VEFRSKDNNDGLVKFFYPISAFKLNKIDTPDGKRVDSFVKEKLKDISKDLLLQRDDWTCFCWSERMERCPNPVDRILLPENSTMAFRSDEKTYEVVLRADMQVVRQATVGESEWRAGCLHGR
jgi:hypothetical protein